MSAHNEQTSVDPTEAVVKHIPVVIPVVGALLIFLLAGALGGVAGGLFASLQSYITPDAFTFEMLVLFFIAILIGGRGSILGPVLGTIILTALPEFAAPLVQWSTFLYAALLLLIVLALKPAGLFGKAVTEKV